MRAYFGRGAMPVPLGSGLGCCGAGLCLFGVWLAAWRPAGPLPRRGLVAGFGRELLPLLLPLSSSCLCLAVGPGEGGSLLVCLHARVTRPKRPLAFSVCRLLSRGSAGGCRSGLLWAWLVWAGGAGAGPGLRAGGLGGGDAPARCVWRCRLWLVATWASGSCVRVVPWGGCALLVCGPAWCGWTLCRAVGLRAGEVACSWGGWVGVVWRS